MRGYAKFRVVLLLGMLGLALFVSQSPYARAADTPAAPTPAKDAKPPHVNPFAIVLDNIDFVFVIILVCSIIGLTLIIQGFIKARASVLMPVASTNQIEDLIERKALPELLEFTDRDSSFISNAINAALKRAPAFPVMKEAMETAIGEQTAEQFRKIEYLNIIGNLGPLLGLLGTVLGMINSFQSMSLSGGNADPKVLAGGISQALTHTMLGLMLALPCLAAFGILRTIMDRLTVQGALMSEELLMKLKRKLDDTKPGSSVAAPRQAVAVATPKPVVAPIARKTAGHE